MDRRRRHPQIRVVLALSKRVAGMPASRTQGRTCFRQCGTGPHNFRLREERPQSNSPGLSPSGHQRAGLNLHKGLEADEPLATGDDRVIQSRESMGTRAQPSAEDVRVDDDRAAGGSRHLVMASTNASHCASVRSGIAVSSRGGAGRARRSNSSRDSSRDGSSLIGRCSIDPDGSDTGVPS